METRVKPACRSTMRFQTAREATVKQNVKHQTAWLSQIGSTKPSRFASRTSRFGSTKPHASFTGNPLKGVPVDAASQKGDPRDA